MLTLYFQKLLVAPDGLPAIRHTALIAVFISASFATTRRHYLLQFPVSSRVQVTYTLDLR